MLQFRELQMLSSSLTDLHLLQNEESSSNEGGGDSSSSRKRPVIEKDIPMGQCFRNLRSRLLGCDEEQSSSSRKNNNSNDYKRLNKACASRNEDLIKKLLPKASPSVRYFKLK